MAQRQVWKPHFNWLAAGAIGLVSFGFGLYLLIDSDNATQLIGAIIGFALLFVSLVHLLQGLRRETKELVARLALLSGGVGATVGTIVTLDLAYDYLAESAARLILAGGLIVYGVLGLAGIAVDRKSEGLVRTLLASVVALAFAALLIYNSQSDELESRWFAAALIILGLILLGLAALNHHQRAAALQQRETTADSDGSKKNRRPVSPETSSSSEQPHPTTTGPSGVGPEQSARTSTGRAGATGTDNGDSPSAPIIAGPPRMATTEEPAGGTFATRSDSADDMNFDPFTGERIRRPDDPTLTGDVGPDGTSSSTTPPGRGPFSPQRP
ncbi:MAG TPA: hypothetical protein VGT61_06290 [Thermomicrobiales bacterium]|jgi:uncharacterized membrane protein HdeD (DUF308 family)|nr:hypothetical protein [Thermomicrobiales bacterium]